MLSNKLCFAFLLGLIASRYCVAVEFTDCGSGNIDIQDIAIEACGYHKPCRLFRGLPYIIVVTLNRFERRILEHEKDLEVNVFAIIRGALFEVEARLGSTCGYLCPHEHSSDIPITVELSPTLMRGPAPMMINATLFSASGTTIIDRFCIQFDIYVA